MGTQSRAKCRQKRHRIAIMYVMARCEHREFDKNKLGKTESSTLPPAWLRGAF